MIKILKFLGTAAAVFLLLMVILCPLTLAADTKGSNVWDDELKMPSTYTWTPSIYSGLWYDLDKGVYTENITLSITASDRFIESGNANYVTEVKPYRFAYSDWGSYNLIAWQGEPYFAGYQRYSSGNMSTAQFANSNISTLSNQKIYRVLTDSDSERRLGSGDTYSLENGYRIRVTEINESRKEFRLALERDGTVVESKIVSENTTFVYEKGMDGIGAFPIIAIHVKTTDADKAVIDGIFQISESSTDVSVNRKINAMEIQSVNETQISMKNTDRIRLNAGSTVTLMGYMKIDVQNSSQLAFKLISDPKTDSEKKYDLRGSVYDNSNTMKNWSDLHYSGFSSDWKNESGTEELSFNVSGSIQRSIPPKGIEYHVDAFNKKFNYSGWGSYQALRLNGAEYFAGYIQYDSSNKSNTTNFSQNNTSLLFDGNVSKVLINNDTNRAYSENSTINLEEGYSLHIGNASENESGKFNLTLRKGGSVVKEAAVGSNETFVYETRIGGIDIPIIAVYVSNISGDSVRIRGIFQISSEVTNVGIGKSIDLMQVEYISRGGLIFMNKETIDLSKGKDIRLIGNLTLHVADSDELRFFPYGGNSSNDKRDLRIEVPEIILPYQEITVKVFQSEGNNWNEAGNAVVTINGKNAGTTNSSGSITATLQEAGTYEFRAEKNNYTAANISKATGDNGNYLSIVLPEYIFKGDLYNVQVKDNESNNIAGASVYINGSLVGETDNFGIFSLTALETGSDVFMVSKSGYMPNSMSATILEDAPYFVVRNIVFPESISANKTARISVEIENVGTEKGTQTILITSGNNTSTKKYTLDTGAVQRFTLNVKPNEAGTNSIVIGNQTFQYYAEESSGTETPWNWVLLGGVGLILFAALIIGITYYQETQNEKGHGSNRKDSRFTHEKKAAPGFFSRFGTKSEKPASRSTGSQKSPASMKKGSGRFSSSHKSPELKNSQKRARSKKE